MLHTVGPASLGHRDQALLWLSVAVVVLVCNRAVLRIRMGVHHRCETFFWKCQQRYPRGYYGAQSSFTLHQFFCSIGICYGQI